MGRTGNRLRLWIALGAVLLLGPLASRAQEPPLDWRQRGNLPVWAEKLFREQKFRNRYLLSFHLNPFYLRGDFNGDGPNDVAMLVRAIDTRRVGIAIFHAGLNQVFIVGGEEDNLPEGVDLRKMDSWTVFADREVGPGLSDEPPPRIKGEAIQVQRTGMPNALIYWNGSGYRWYLLAE